MLSLMRAALQLAALSTFCSGFNIREHAIYDFLVAVYTPMKGPLSLQLDLEAIPKYAKHVKARNITNVMPAGTNGESLSLTVSERKALAEAWGKAGMEHGLKIFMHIGAESLADSMELMEHASKTPGIYGALAMTPVYFKPSLVTLHSFLAALGGAAPKFPLWFYHFPDDTGVLRGQAHALLEAIDQAGDIPNFMGIKYTDYDLMDFSLCVQLKGRKYNMLYGRDEQALAALDMGADGGASSTINYAPSLREAIRFYRAGDRKAAFEKQAENARLCSMFGKYAGYNVQKNIMKMVNMDVGGSRLPNIDLDNEKFTELKSDLIKLNFIDQPSDMIAV